jgi:adenosine kinase
MSRDWSWTRAARLASVMGALKIGHRGGQNHRPARGDIERTLEAAFGDTLS